MNSNPDSYDHPRHEDGQGCKPMSENTADYVELDPLDLTFSELWHRLRDTNRYPPDVEV